MSSINQLKPGGLPEPFTFISFENMNFLLYKVVRQKGLNRLYHRLITI